MACSALNMYWKCSVVLCQTVLPAVASTGSPTGSPRSLPKRAKSPHPENGQRLAGNADKLDRMQRAFRPGNRPYGTAVNSEHSVDVGEHTCRQSKIGA